MDKFQIILFVLEIGIYFHPKQVECSLTFIGRRIKRTNTIKTWKPLEISHYGQGFQYVAKIPNCSELDNEEALEFGNDEYTKLSQTRNCLPEGMIQQPVTQRSVVRLLQAPTRDPSATASSQYSFPEQPYAPPPIRPNMFPYMPSKNYPSLPPDIQSETNGKNYDYPTQPYTPSFDKTNYNKEPEQNPWRQPFPNFSESEGGAKEHNYHKAPKQQEKIGTTTLPPTTNFQSHTSKTHNWPTSETEHVSSEKTNAPYTTAHTSDGYILSQSTDTYSTKPVNTYTHQSTKYLAETGTANYSTVTVIEPDDPTSTEIIPTNSSYLASTKSDEKSSHEPVPKNDTADDYNAEDPEQDGQIAPNKMPQIQSIGEKINTSKTVAFSCGLILYLLKLQQFALSI